MIMQLFLHVLLSVIVAMSWASKDTHEYPYTDFQNPNVAYKMYWRDSQNIISDLSSFQSLSVKYHSCVYSEYFDGGEENYGYGDESDYWYLGLPMSYKANVAFSLYGTLKESRTQGGTCDKTTYINSFFTIGGVETIAYPLGIDTTYANSYCVEEEEQDSKDRDLRRARQLSEDEESGDDSTSTALGCNATADFVLDQFQGEYCNTMNYLNTTDDLQEFNVAMQDIDCETVYDASTDVGDDDGYVPPVYSLLSASRACSLRMYPGICPDEHGLLTLYTNNLEEALYMARQGRYYEFALAEEFQPIPFKNVFSFCFVILGLCMMNYSYSNYKHLVRRNGGETPVLKYKLSLWRKRDDWKMSMWRKRKDSNINKSNSEDSEDQPGPPVPSELDEMRNALEMVGSHVVESSIVVGNALAAASMDASEQLFGSPSSPTSTKPSSFEQKKNPSLDAQSEDTTSTPKPKVELLQIT